ncbi:MAG: methyl-accepting chemotaxis protein [Tepidibacillus sp.]
MRLMIKQKLIGSFLVISLIFTILTGFTYYSLYTIDSSYSNLVNRDASIVANTIGIESNINLQSNAIRGVILVGDQTNIKNLNDSNAKVDELIQQTLPLIYSEEEKKKLNQLQELNKQYKQIADQVVLLVEENREQAIQLSTNDLTSLVREMRNITREIESNYKKIMSEKAQGNKETADTTENLVLIFSSVAIILAIVIGYMFSKMISTPIITITKNASKISSGDLSGDEIRVKTKDELFFLAESFNTMTKNLKQLIDEIGLSSQQLSSSSEQLTASAEQTAKATEYIATTIEQTAHGAQVQNESANETATAIEEMSLGIQRIAENASLILENSSETLKQAEDGNQFVNNTVLQMEQIFNSVNESNESIQQLFERSNRIQQIIDVIKSIADQTNLLALNAAIEAARAGENGRGFAVVAEEVRKLAEESGKSASLISDIIHEIQVDTKRSVEIMEIVTEQVEDGRKIANETEQKFQMILHSTRASITPIEEMSAAAEEMSASSEEVTATVTTIAQISKETSGTTQNIASSAEEQLASMEEINSSAAALSQMAEELQELIRRFKL